MQWNWSDQLIFVTLHLAHLVRSSIPRMTSLSLLCSVVYYTYNLEVRNADIKTLIHISVPHNSDVCDEESPQITLRESKHGVTFIYSHCKLFNHIRCTIVNFISI